MKLRNKKTGEIKEFSLFDGKELQGGATLESLTDEWEDYEEPKGYWYIDPMACGVYFTKIEKDKDLCEFNKQIGNFFETEEEAEKVVEKLKAFKRLKDKGFRFGGWKRDERFYGDYTIEAQDYTTCSDKDLDICFGGEE